MTIKQQKSSPSPSDDNSEVVADSPESPDVLMSSEECDIIIEDAMAQKVVNECQKSRLSLETMIHNVCQDVAVTLMSLEWQKDLQRDIQRNEPHLKLTFSLLIHTIVPSLFIIHW